MAPKPAVQENTMSDQIILQQAMMESRNLSNASGDGAGLGAQTIRIVLPRSGVLRRFTKLWPTEGAKPPYMSVRYTTRKITGGIVPVLYIFTIVLLGLFGAVGLKTGGLNRGLPSRAAATGAGIYILLIAFTRAGGVPYDLKPLLLTGLGAWLLGFGYRWMRQNQLEHERRDKNKANPVL